MIVVLIPAHNEEDSIARTIEGVLAQDRQADRVVVIPNGCVDRTTEIARQYPVTVMELPRLEHRKSEALNLAWSKYGQEAKYVVTVDADTYLPPNALGEWERELNADYSIGGSTAKFTVQTPGLIGRLQKSEYAVNIYLALRRGWTHVLAGAGTMYSNLALHKVADLDDRVGPWAYHSAVEDYDLTTMLRKFGYRALVSPYVRGYTDGMSTVRGLWGQRMKWHVGTLTDLMDLGVNRWTRWDWKIQIISLVAPFMRLLWLAVLALALSLGALSVPWWAWSFVALYVIVNFHNSLLIPHRDWKDTLIAVTILPNEFFQVLRSAWICATWIEVLWSRIRKKRRDLWAAQYTAEGV